MVLSDKQKKYIIEGLVLHFDRNEEEAKETLNLLQDLLDGKNEYLLFELQYKLFISEDFEYGKKLSKFIFRMFSYLYDTSVPEDRDTIFRLTSYIFESLFVEKYIHDNRIEKQSRAALNILKNISKHLNMIIHTQEKMIASLSHEMRTSLNGIMGYLHMLDNSNSLNREESEYLKKALNSSETLNSLIKDILDITKLNSQQMEVTKSWFLLDEMMMESLEQLGINIKSKNSVKFKCSPPLVPYYVYGDKLHIMEILINFLTNAYKYTDKGYIEFSMDYSFINDKIRAIFSVRDTGLGIDKEQQKHIFKEYNRYHKEREGIGLGLYIAKRLADKLGAKIYLESQLGKGSTFYLDITFNEIKPYKLEIEGRKIFFLIKTKSHYYSLYMKKKLEYLKDNRVFVKVFTQESSLISYLLENTNIIPDLVSFFSDDDPSFIKFDALVYYLKNEERYKNCIFVAEGVSSYISLKYFDKTTQFCFPVSQYDKFLSKRSKSGRFGDIKDVSANILVVDDIETNLEVFKMLSNKYFPNIKVDTSKGALEALGMCRVKEYDIIFIDLKMPNIDGFELIKRLKSELISLPPIYAFSADLYKDTYNKIYEHGFEGIAEKPINIDALYQIFKRHI